MESSPGNGPFFRYTAEANQKKLVLHGVWTLENLAAIKAGMAQRPVPSGTVLDSRDIDALDTAGALYLKELIVASKAPPVLSADQATLLDFLPEPSPFPTVPPNPSGLRGMFIAIGKQALVFRTFLFEILTFIGLVSMRFGYNILHPRRFRPAAIARQIEATGINALPIVALLAVLIAMVISYQASLQLQKFGADIFTIDLTVISLLREMAVLITAILVAGRSGSAFAAELGVMKMREEIDALRTMGLDPVEVLVLPRVLALIITLPLLTFIADIVGLMGGALMATVQLDIPLGQYLDRVETVATPTMFFVGIVKAPVFAFIIAVIGTFQGMSVSGSAEDVGRKTTIAVVQSIFFVIMADAVFSIIFAAAGI